MKENGKKNKIVLTPATLFLRIAVGAYLLYTVYGLRNTLLEYSGRELVFFAAVMVIFSLIAAFLLIHSGYCLIKGQYKKRTEEEPEEKEEDNE